MRRLLLVGLVVVGSAWCGPVQAQILFKKARPNPSQRVPELILAVKTEPDERKRSFAVEELREFDARTYSEIVPVLVDVLQHDQKPSVRVEAVNTLSRLRPVTQPAGHALERAAASDDSWRVRVQAKSALVKYYLAGYSSNRVETTTPAKGVTTSEPPLADPPGTAPALAPTVPAIPTSFPRPALQPVQGQAPPTIEIEIEGPALAPAR